jgi:hypothetical protein
MPRSRRNARVTCAELAQQIHEQTDAYWKERQDMPLATAARARPAVAQALQTGGRGG